MEEPRGPAGVTDLFARMGERIMAGRLREVSARHVFPCPVEAGGEMRVLRDAAEFEIFLGALRAGLLAEGVVALVPRVAAVELPRDGRFRVWLHWARRHADGVERPEGHAAIYYLVRQPSGRLAVEMMAFMRLAPAGWAVPSRRPAR